MAIDTPSGVQLRIRGKVQGVGFRPLSGSWRSSCDYTATCVMTATASSFGCWKSRRNLLPRSIRIARRWRIDSVEHASLVWERAPTDFTIRQSAGGSMNTQIVPDAATCPACLAEMNTRASGATVILSSIAPTADHASPLFALCPMTGHLR